MDVSAQTVSGAVAGVASTIVMHPLDVIKAKLQVGTAASFRLAVHQLTLHPASAYRGLSTNLLGNAVAWGAYYGLYGEVQKLNTSLGIEKGPFYYWISSFTAGILTQAATNPIWVLKTRMLASHSHDPGAYHSMTSGIKDIISRHGIAGLWRGFTPGMLGPLQSSIHFMIYEELKPHINTDWPDSLRYFIASACSKSLAATIMYPHQVVRSRMQFNNHGLWHTIQDVWYSHGIRGFYRGLTANLLRVVPAISVTQVVYENVYKNLMAPAS